MKKSTAMNRALPVARYPYFRVTATPLGCAILLLAAGRGALAADAATGASAAPDEALEEVVVTGIRKSIEDSIAVKKDEQSIVEVVSAEDIGKLPDSSIAESIARLPGIAAQRTNGRAQTLSIRGLGPDFTVTTFNGREQATTNDNRTVEFDQYPSELVTQVKIYKTPNAGMTYQGVAGTTDIETVHPLSYDARKTSMTYRREHDQQGANIPGLPDNGDRGSFTYINQFLDHTFGVAFGVAFNKTPYQAQTREPWGYATDPDDSSATIIGGDKDGVQSSYYERMGYLGVLEFQPNDKLHMVVDGYHSNFKELQTVRRMEFGTVWSGATLSDPGSIEQGRRQSGTFADVPFMVIENYNNDRHAKLDSLGWNTEFDPNENWSLNGDLSWSKVKRDDLRLESTAGTGSGADSSFPPASDSITFTTDNEGITHFVSSGNYSDYNSVFLADPGGWGGGPTRAGYLGHPSTNDEIKAIKIAATRKLDWLLNDVSFGVNYAERTKSKYEWQSNLYLPGGVSHAVVPDQYRTGVLDTSFFGNPYGMIGYDALSMYHDSFWTVIDARDDTNANLNDRIFDYTNTWKVKEKLTTAYVKFDINTQLGSIPLTGNIGVQAVTADQKSTLNLTTGVVNTGTGMLDVSTATYGDKYTDVLPSMNLIFDLANQTKLRFSAAVTETRPRMDDMAGGATYSAIADGGSPVVANGQTYYWTRNGGGNPKLRPWKANAVDLSLEKYFSNKGYLSAAVYYKSLTSYIYNKSQIVSFDGVLLPDQTSASDPTAYTQADANREGVATVKANGSGGYIKGAEFAASLPLSTFADALDGFGFIFSAAINSSSIKINGTPTPIPGLSTHVYNSTVYYEKGGFSARVSNRYRGSFIGEVPAFDSSLTLQTVKQESLLDAQVGYEFQDSSVLKGLSVSLSGTNLTDAPFVLSNVGSSSYNLTKYQKYGAVYALSLTYKF